MAATDVISCDVAGSEMVPCLLGCVKILILSTGF